MSTVTLWCAALFIAAPAPAAQLDVGPGPMPPVSDTCAQGIFDLPQSCAGRDGGWASLTPTSKAAVRVGDSVTFTYTGPITRLSLDPLAVEPNEPVLLDWSWGVSSDLGYTLQGRGCEVVFANVSTTCTFTITTPDFVIRKQDDGSFGPEVGEFASGWTKVTVDGIVSDSTPEGSKASMWLPVLNASERIVSGRVLDRDGKRFAGVKVTATRAGGDYTSAVTSATGDYELVVPKTTWVLDASTDDARSFSPREITVDTTTGDRTGQDFQETCPIGSSGPVPRGRTRGTGTVVRAPHGRARPFDPSPKWMSTNDFSVTQGCHGIEWEMAANYSEFVTPETLLEARKRLYPAAWDLRLMTWNTNTNVRYCKDNEFLYEWTIRPVGGGAAKVVPARSCMVETSVPKLGRYDVWAKEFKKNATGAYVATGNEFSRKIIVQDLLFAGLGDSNSSGEGNPPFFGDQRCNRSTDAYQFRTARGLEAADRHTSISLLFFGCSGALTKHLWSTPFEGVRPLSNQTVPPQFKQVKLFTTPPSRKEADRRKLAGVLLSIGVNDVLFAPFLRTCVANGRCAAKNGRYRIRSADGDAALERIAAGDPPRPREGTLRMVFGQRIKQLQDNYAAVDKNLTLLGPMSNRDYVFITQYPDFTFDEGGRPCFNDLPFSPGGWQFFRDSGKALNSTVAQTKKRFGWKPISGISKAFSEHGYCAKARERWMVPLTSAATTLIKNGRHSPILTWRWNLEGAFHPTWQGHQAAADATVPQVCTVVYGNPRCEGFGYPQP